MRTFWDERSDEVSTRGRWRRRRTTSGEDLRAAAVQEGSTVTEEAEREEEYTAQERTVEQFSASGGRCW